MRTSGFTLIELLAVIAIMVLIGSLAGAAVVGASGRITIDEATARIIAYEAGARVYSSRYGRPTELTIDLTGVQQLEADDSSGAIPRPPLRLPDQYMLEAIDASGWIDEAFISSAGRSRSYAVRVRVKESDIERWLVFLGLTGQAVVYELEDDARALLELEESRSVTWIEEPFFARP